MSKVKSSKVSKEISKDTMLFKTLFVIVSFFCIGTELRFLSMLDQDQEPSNATSVDTEKQ